MFALHLFSEEGPNTELGWLLWTALGFFFLMVVVGWLVSRRKAAPETGHAHEAKKPADDLTIIEGIGPKVAKVLNEAGIASFSDLANAPASEVQKALDAAGLQMMDPTGWIEQARLAARGDMEGLKKMQAELKGGRRAN